jgi:hypothetical protein
MPQNLPKIIYAGKMSYFENKQRGGLAEWSEGYPWQKVGFKFEVALGQAIILILILNLWP